MNCGLGNLATLRAFLVSDAEQAKTTYNAKLAIIGKGVAGLMEGYCNRKWFRTVNDTVVFSGGRPHYFVPRYPFEGTPTVDMKITTSDDWTSFTGSPQMLEPSSGLVRFGFSPGQIDLALLRITYTGGYWFDTTEDSSGSLPSGATALPDDLQLAWLTICAEYWNKFDKLGIAITGDPDKKTKIGELNISPFAKEILRRYKRQQLT